MLGLDGSLYVTCSGRMVNITEFYLQNSSVVCCIACGVLHWQPQCIVAMQYALWNVGRSADRSVDRMPGDQVNG